MAPSLLDNPLILSFIFHPQPARPHTSRLAGVTDGAIPVEGDVALGYRLYAYPDAKSVVLFFHGNGEIAPDYDGAAPLYWRSGASLMVVDYRGYGWSTGRPTVGSLLPDMEPLHSALPEILSSVGLGGRPLIVMGRSLGSAPAIHLARRHPDTFRGLIIESGFTGFVALLARLGLPTAALGLKDTDDPLDNLAKMRAIALPLLVIHGEEDTLIPVEHGQMLYDASPASHKTIHRVAGAGHNDLHYYAEEYFAAIAAFIAI